MRAPAPPGPTGAELRAAGPAWGFRAAAAASLPATQSVGQLAGGLLRLQPAAGALASGGAPPDATAAVACARWLRRPRRCGCGARAAAACTGVRLTHSHAAPGAQFPSQQPQHTTSSGRHVRPTAAAGGYEEMPHAGTAGGHTPRATAKDARASFRPQQTAHAADDSNKKGCSSTYRGVRQRPWGRCGFAALP